MIVLRVLQKLLFIMLFAAVGCPNAVRPTVVEQVSLQVKTPTQVGVGWRALAPGDELTIGDRFALRIEVSAPVYLYVSQRSPGGQLVALLPPEGTAPAQVAPGLVTQLPSGDGAWFQLDDKPGEEDLYVVASTALMDRKAVQSEMDRAPKDRGDPPPLAGGKNKRSADPVEKRGYDRVAQALVKPLDTRGVAVLRFWLRHR